MAAAWVALWGDRGGAGFAWAPGTGGAVPDGSLAWGDVPLVWGDVFVTWGA